MKKLEVYDPAMCCSTGVCGTEVDSKLVQFASDLNWLKEQGVTVERFNLAQQPSAFVANATVQSLLMAKGNDVLPLVLIDGEIAMKGVYPTRQQLAQLAGVKESSPCCCEEDEPEEKSSSCCSSQSGKSSCC